MARLALLPPALVTVLAGCASSPPKDTGPVADDTACPSPATWYADADGDGHGDAASSSTACTQPAGHSATADDCDDGAAAVHPGAKEVWYDGADEDCSGGSDFDQDGDGYDRDAECDDLDPTRYPDAGAVEVWYNGVDENCDGNDGDQDGDGWYAAAYPFEVPPAYASRTGDCQDDPAADGPAPLNGLPDVPAAQIHPTAPDAWYDGIDADCAADDDFDADLDLHRTDAWSDEAGRRGDDCADTDPAVHAGAEDAWYDGVDADCQGNNDYDADGDSYSAGGGTGAPDCDDANADVHPDTPERCATTTDDDCDGATNDPDAVGCTVWYADADRDGYGDGAGDCLCEPEGTTTAARSGDCDDASAAVNPGVPEVCNGVDDDCDRTADDGLGTWYLDADGDGYGSTSATGTCLTGSTNNTDCDDTDADVWPLAPELCDGQANDCRGGWTRDSEAGLASEQAADGTWTDLTATLGAGTSRSPVAWALRDGTTLQMCSGTWYVSFTTAAGAAESAVVGIAGADTTILDGAGIASVIFTVAPMTLTVSGVTLQHGASPTGGGIYVGGGTLSLSDAAVRGNTAEREGGGIYAVNAEVTVTDTVVDGNTSGSDGGGLYILESGLSLDNVEVTANTAGPATDPTGGGLYFGTGGADDLLVQGCTFQDNTVSANVGTAYGGGLNLQSTGTGSLTLEDTVIASNVALGSGSADGGGVWSYLATTGATVWTDVLLTGNNAFAPTLVYAGGLSTWNEGSGTVTFTRLRAEDNSTVGSRSYGAGLVLQGTYSGAFELDACSVTGNTTFNTSYGVSGTAGGIYLALDGSEAVLDATSVNGNATSTVGGIYLDLDHGSTVTVQNGSEIDGNTGHGIELQQSDLTAALHLEDSSVTHNTSAGLYLLGAGASTGANATCTGSATGNAAIYGNGNYGVYDACDDGETCLFSAIRCDFDAADGTSNDPADVHMGIADSDWPALATFTCDGATCE